MAHSTSLFLVASLLIGVALVSAIDKPNNFITNGYYTAFWDDSTVGFFPYVQSGPSHSVGAHKAITYPGNTSYFSVLLDESVYSAADFRESLVSATKTSATRYTEVYKLVTFNATLGISITTEIHGDHESDSYVTIRAGIKIDDCDQYSTEDAKESIKIWTRPKFRYLLDIDVNEDDGPTVATYINQEGRVRGGVIEVEEYANEHTWYEDASFAALSFASDWDSKVNAYDYNVYVTTRGLGADAYQYVSWLDASESTDFYYNETGANCSDPMLDEFDDSALIAYYDTQLCGDGEGYHLLCSEERVLEVKLFATLASHTPTSHQCPYCNVNGGNDEDGNSIPDHIDINKGRDTSCALRQGDWDGDNFGDSTDFCPWMATHKNHDRDHDLIGDDCDNCPRHYNPSQLDFDGDHSADACDNCPYDWNPDQDDTDGDLVGDVCDNCRNATNPDQRDEDHDTWGDECDTCPGFFNYDNEDFDLDGFGDECDNCPNVTNPFQLDMDNDTIGDACDNCVNEWNFDQSNVDGDWFGDVCDNCPEIVNDDQYDNDTDGVGDACDNCNAVFNPNQTNSDGDNYGDDCDICPFAYDNEQWNSDFDVFGDACDNCPFLTNEDQADADGDNVGDICDNCEFSHNPNQLNTDGDIWGDACDPCLRSRWSEDIIAVHDGDAPNVLVYDGCYLSDYVDDCTKDFCVSANQAPIARDPRISQTIY